MLRTVETSTESPRDVRTVFAGLMLVMLLSALDSTIVSTALPTIVGELGGLDHLSWVVTAYLLASTVVTPIYGKLGDLYGRKRVFQAAILIFLAGSVLCGLSQNLLMLILCRALQGLGGGGLIVGAQAIIGDIVSPRDRGRYQGIFGAVFGISNVAGPLVGGFIVEHLSWRWIFYINLPLGFVAFAVIGAILRVPIRRTAHQIDYLGAALIASCLSSVVLLTTLAGSRYPWSSAPILTLIAVSLVTLAAFIVVERRAPEPVVPLTLFKNPIFAVASAIGFIVGFALLGSVTFLPLYLQVVKGIDPADSGLQLLPMMIGMLTMSISSGQVISRIGRYKMFPIGGTALMTLGLFLLSRLDADTSPLAIALNLLILGAGMGSVMQVLVLAVQNSVPYHDLGVATSGATLFRAIGGSLGVSVLGAIFSIRLNAVLGETVVVGEQMVTGTIAPAVLRQMSEPMRLAVVHAYADALHAVFLSAMPVAAVGFLLSWLLKEIPLRRTVEASGIGESFAIPKDTNPVAEIERALSVLVSRDVRKRAYEEMARRANLDLEPIDVWVLLRLDERLDGAADGIIAADDLVHRFRGEPQRLAAAFERLQRDGRLASRVDASTGARVLSLTADGRALADRLVKAKEEGLRELLAGWSPERHADLAAMLTRIARGLATDPHYHERAAPASASPRADASAG